MIVNHALPEYNLFGELTPPQAPPRPSYAEVYQAYERGGGRLDKVARNVLGQQARRLLGEGHQMCDIASAASELGRDGKFPAFLGRVLRERPIPCVNGAARLRLTREQLARCTCPSCKEWADLRAEHPLEI